MGKARKSGKSGKTKRSVEVAYLDPPKLELLKQLAVRTRIPRAVLVREAIDDLLVKHRLLPRLPKPQP